MIVALRAAQAQSNGFNAHRPGPLGPTALRLGMDAPQGHERFLMRPASSSRPHRSRSLPIRRRAGDPWPLYRIFYRGLRGGFLVIDPRSSRPVASVRGTGPAALGTALAIVADTRRAAAACDLRGASKARVRRTLGGLLLRPVDRLGRVFHDPGCIAAAYRDMLNRDMRTGKVERVFAFYREYAPPAAAQEKSGTPAQPHVPAPASKRDAKAGKLMAA